MSYEEIFKDNGNKLTLMLSLRKGRLKFLYNEGGLGEIDPITGHIEGTNGREAAPHPYLTNSCERMVEWWTRDSSKVIIQLRASRDKRLWRVTTTNALKGHGI